MKSRESVVSLYSISNLSVDPEFSHLTAPLTATSVVSNLSLLESYFNPEASVFAATDPVADVANNGKHVVSEDSSAALTLVTPSPLIVIVFVAPVPEATTPSPTKLRVVAVVDKGFPSS